MKIIIGILLGIDEETAKKCEAASQEEQQLKMQIISVLKKRKHFHYLGNMTV